MNEKIKGLYETLAGLAPQMHHAVDSLQREIDAKQTELGELREAHSQATKILYAVDPDSRPTPTTKSPRKKIRVDSGVSDELVDKVYDWLVAHVDSETFWGNQIVERNDFDVTTQTTLSRALNVLHERGKLRLDHTGMGGRKIFALTNV